jgi:hypothetical protein
MKMLALLASLASLSLVLSCGGGGVSSAGIPEAEACSQSSTTFCQKIFGCTDPSSVLVKAVLTSEVMCETTVLQYCGATGFQCSAGATYHGDKAQTCKDQFNAEDCATLSGGLIAGLNGGSMSMAVASITANFPACAQICTGGSDGGGTG